MSLCNHKVEKNRKFLYFQDRTLFRNQFLYIGKLVGKNGEKHTI